MAIETQTNFIIQAAAPADDRNVVADISARENIEYKFPGLKTFVLSEGVTYVYGTDSEWRLDGGGNNSGGNGIYGGSGSLPGDVSVFLGTLSNAVNDRSNYLYYENRGLADDDKNLLYNYAYRKSNGNNFDTMAFRTEQKLIPFGSSTLQGPYLEYNGVNPSDSTLVGSLNIGVGNYPTLLQKRNKVSITPVGVDFYSGDDPSTESPITITKNYNSYYTTVGYNSSSTLNEYFRINEPSYRMVFGDGFEDDASKWDFDTRIISSETWNTLIKIDAKNEPNAVSSNVNFLVDSSSRDWDGVSTRTPTLLTPQQIVRDIEHKYSKIQMWGAGTLNSISNNILYLNTDGNSFEVTLGNFQIITDIKSFKTSSLDFPNGTIITIKFINFDPQKPGFLRLHDGKNISKIKSDLTDATFEKSDNTKLTINHDTTADINNKKNGEIITFRKFNQGTNQWWEIVNVSRERKIVTRNWTTGITGDWNFLLPVRWLNVLSSSGKFVPYGDTNITNSISLENPPNKFYVPSSPSFTVGQSREVTNPDGFAFRISVDGNRIVFAQGNFRIDIKENLRNTNTGNNIRRIFFKSYDSRKNVWAVGKISNVGLLPQWETVWTPVQTYARGEYTSNVFYQLEVINPILSINRLGDILLSFEAEPSYNVNLETFMQSVNFEVWVPPFSYTAATGSYTTGGGAGPGPGGS